MRKGREGGKGEGGGSLPNGPTRASRPREGEYSRVSGREKSRRGGGHTVAG